MNLIGWLGSHPPRCVNNLWAPVWVYGEVQRLDFLGLSVMRPDIVSPPDGGVIWEMVPTLVLWSMKEKTQ